MTITQLKNKLQKSLQVFLYAITFNVILTFVVIYFDIDKWVIGTIPAVILFSLIGSFTITKALVYLSSISEIRDSFCAEELEPRFNGVSGVSSMFYVLLFIIYITVFLILAYLGINIFDFKTINLMVTVCIFILQIVCIYFAVDHLSFVLFFISIIYGWTKTAKAKRTTNSIETKTFIEGYDVETNIKEIMKKYSDRIGWFESHLNEKNEAEYNAKIAIYQRVLNDINDIMDGIDV